MQHTLSLQQQALDLTRRFTQSIQKELIIDAPGQNPQTMTLDGYWQRVPTVAGMEVFHVHRSTLDDQPIIDELMPHINMVFMKPGSHGSLRATNNVRITCITGRVFVNRKEITSYGQGASEFYLSETDVYQFVAMDPTYLVVKFLQPDECQ